MGYQFTNNWPYSASVFPSMDDHIDPVNNEYFTGLHSAVADLQYFLGMNPEKGFADVAQKLNLHDHTGGDKGAAVPYLMAQYTELSPDDNGDVVEIGLTKDGTWRSLDISTWIPAAADMLHIRVICESSATEKWLQLRNSSSSKNWAVANICSQVAGGKISADLFITHDGTRTLEYNVDSTYTSLQIFFAGYFTNLI